MKPEYVEDMVREGDVVVIRTVVLQVMAGGAIRTQSVHPPSFIRSHERVFRAGDRVRGKTGPDNVTWTVIHVSGDMAWVNRRNDKGDIGHAFVGLDEMVHAIPAIVVDNYETD